MAVLDLVDRRPKKTGQSDWEHLPERICALLRGMDWAADAEARLREEGHIFMGEALVAGTRAPAT